MALKVGVYEQVGLNITGEAAGDIFGWSVSMSANGATFVAGALNNGSGTVGVYKFNSIINNYAQVGSSIVGEAAGDEFGYSVSMSGDGTTFAVGARLNNGMNGSDTGHARVYKFNSTINTYTQVGLDIDGEAADDYFGESVSISADGNTFIVGAPLNDGNGAFSGHVRVFKYNPTLNTYAQVGLDINGEQVASGFGISVSISADGTTFAVGAPFNNNGNGTSSGHVRVYGFISMVNSFDQIGLDIDGEATGDRFGYSVSISADGTTIAVGATGNSGYVRVYKYDSTLNTYAQVGLDINGEAIGDWFGRSVSISGDGTAFVVGAPRYDSNGTIPGYVRVYKYNSTLKSYAQVGMNINGDYYFGNSVSISADGSTFIAGTPAAGYVSIYRDSFSTKAPTKSPTKNPTKQPTRDPTKAPTKAPLTISPTTSAPTACSEQCGLFGWNLFCLRRGTCGRIKRLLNLCSCD